MKILNYIFRPYITMRKLQRENLQLTQDLEKMKDMNESLWEMLEEIKESEKQADVYYHLLNTKSVGEA